MDKTADDVLFTLGYTGEFSDLYREPDGDAGIWTTPYASQISDESGSPGFQHTDVGAISADPILFYIFTGSRCGITQPARP